jgi:uncharacterized protein YlxW (UPF0749 family)
VNPFVSRITGNNWVVPVTLLSLVLGFMMTLAWMNEGNRAARLSRLDPDAANRYLQLHWDEVENSQKSAEEVEKLRAEISKLQTAVASQTSAGKLLNDSLQEAKAIAGLTEVEGPGVSVTLQDSSKPLPPGVDARNANIHDGDVLQVVNVMWAAGAEAVSVNNHRMGTRSNVTCVGVVVHIDGVPISSPVVIQGIGDPETIAGALNIRDGVLDQIRAYDPNMVELRTFQKARLTAFAGSTMFKYAHAPKVAK